MLTFGTTQKAVERLLILHFMWFPRSSLNSEILPQGTALLNVFYLFLIYIWC